MTPLCSQGRVGFVPVHPPPRADQQPWTTELEMSSFTSQNSALRTGVPGGSWSQGLASGSNCLAFPHQHLFQSRVLCNQDLIKRANLKEVLHLHGKLLQFGFSE